MSATAQFAASGARVHPAARMEGPLSAVRLARGSKISERTVLAVDGPGVITLAADVWLASDCDVRSHTAEGIRIGRGTTVQRGTSIQGTASIGAGCILAPHVFVSSGTHLYDRRPELPIREQERRFPDQTDRPVVIGDDTWIGVNAVVMPGRTIGRGAIIGANAVVTSDVAPYAIVAGAPARTISHRLDWVPPTSLDATLESAIPYLLSGFDLEYGERLVARFDGAASLALESGTAVDLVVEPAGGVEHTVVDQGDWILVTLSTASRSRLIAATVQ